MTNEGVISVDIYGKNIALDASQIIRDYKNIVKRIANNADDDVGIMRKMAPIQRNLTNLFYIVKFQKDYRGISSVEGIYDIITRLLNKKKKRYKLYEKIISIPITPTLLDIDRRALVCAKNNLRRIGAYDKRLYEYIIRQERKMKKYKKKIDKQLEKNRLILSSDSLGSLPLDKLWSLIKHGYDGLGTLGKRDIHIRRNSLSIINTYCDDEHIREMAYKKVFYVNNKIIKLSSKVVKYRNKIAHSLGYESYINYTYELRKYRDKQNATSLLQYYNENIEDIYKKELRLVSNFAEDNGQYNALKPWNILYYINKYVSCIYEKDILCFESHLDIQTVIDTIIIIGEKIMAINVTISMIDTVYQLEIKVDQVIEGYVYIDINPTDYKGKATWEFLGYNFNGDTHYPCAAIMVNCIGNLSYKEYIRLVGKYGECVYSILTKARNGGDYPFVPLDLELQLSKVNSEIFKMCCLETDILGQECVKGVEQAHSLVSTYKLRLLCANLSFDLLETRTSNAYKENFLKFMLFNTYGVSDYIFKEPTSLAKIEVLKMSSEVYHHFHKGGSNPVLYREAIVSFGLGQNMSSVVRKLRNYYFSLKANSETKNLIGADY